MQLHEQVNGILEFVLVCHESWDIAKQLKQLNYSDTHVTSHIYTNNAFNCQYFQCNASYCLPYTESIHLPNFSSIFSCQTFVVFSSYFKLLCCFRNKIHRTIWGCTRIKVKPAVTGLSTTYVTLQHINLPAMYSSTLIT